MVQEQTEKTTNPGDPLDTESSQLVGSFLQRERLKRQFTIEEVAKDTCIHITTIKSIEDNNRAKMPAPVFARGFIKLYAEFLGLDSQEIVDRYNNEIDQFEDNISDNSDVFFNETLAESSSFSNLRTCIIFIFLAGILGLGYYLFLYSSPTDNYQTTFQQEQLATSAETNSPSEKENIPAQVPEQQKQPAKPDTAKLKEPAKPEPEVKIAQPAVKQEAAAELPSQEQQISDDQVAAASSSTIIKDDQEKKLHLRIEFSERTWMQVSLDNETPEQYLFDPADESSWRADEKIKLHIGNAGGVRIFLDGKELPVGGMSGSPLLLTIPDDFTSNN